MYVLYTNKLLVMDLAAHSDKRIWSWNPKTLSSEFRNILIFSFSLLKTELVGRDVGDNFLVILAYCLKPAINILVWHKCIFISF